MFADALTLLPIRFGGLCPLSLNLGRLVNDLSSGIQQKQHCVTYEDIFYKAN